MGSTKIAEHELGGVSKDLDLEVHGVGIKVTDPETGESAVLTVTQLRREIRRQNRE